MYRAGVFHAVPAVIVISEKNYQLHYSESYTGNLHNSDSNSIIEGYQYSIPIDSAFESLMSQNLFFIYSDNRMYWC